MKKFYLLIATGIIAISMSAQQVQLKQVIILNEGPMGGPVTIGSYNPATKNYSQFDIISARFATDVIVENGFIYVAADSLLIKYDADTKQKLDEQTVPGIRELSIWNDQVLVTRGEINGLPSYFQSYDKYSLGLIYELPAVSDDAAEVKVIGDTAYVAVNGFGYVGKLAVVDLVYQTLNREIDLGPDGLNPENVEIGKNGKIITVNSLDWSNISVTKYDVNTSNFQSIKLGAGGGCGASSLSHLGSLYFQQGDNFNGTTETLEKNLGVYDAQASLGFWDTLMINKQIYGMAVDSVTGRIYVSETDFFSFGKVFLFDFYGTVTDSFDVGVSPGTIAMDVRTLVGVGGNEIKDNRIQVRPNPSTGKFQVSIPNNPESELVVQNILGEKVFESAMPDSSNAVVDLSQCPNGIYFLTVKTGKGSVTEKIIKH